MATKERSFSRHVINDQGYILQYPSVSETAHLLQGEPINTLAESKYQQFPLGTKAIQGDRAWRYCKNSAAALTVVGSAIQSPAAIHTDCTEDIVVAASEGETYAIGSHDITITSTANIAAAPWSTANGAAEGYIMINGGTGIGQCRKIKGHTAAVSTNTFIVTVYDGWGVAPIAGDSEVGIIENPYASVVVAAALTTIPIGVNPIAVTASYYFWCQTGGPAAVMCHAAIPVGTMAICGTTAGEVDPMSAFTTEVIMGYMLTPGIKDNDSAIIYLILDT
uniref:Uncharacterized protein n=1 Tax=viral metagenome TaxID=1070528 RepID=A0A6M3JVM4_9ZZZZ